MLKVDISPQIHRRHRPGHLIQAPYQGHSLAEPSQLAFVLLLLFQIQSTTSPQLQCRIYLV